MVPTADHLLTFTVGGNATLLAVGNANPRDEDPYYDRQHRVWQGRALAVVRSNGQNSKGRQVSLDVTTKGLPPARIILSR